MSAQAVAREIDVVDAEAKLAKLNHELKLDLLQAGVDAAGIFDPTPITDLVGAGISVYRGDFVGAGLSLISMIPYAGDAIGKTAKGATLIAKMNGLRKRIAAGIDAVKALRKRGREVSAAAARAKKQARAVGKEVDEAMCEKCLKSLDDVDNPFGTRLPAEGWPDGVTRGDGPWKPDANSSYGKDVLAWQKKNNIEPGTPIEFRQGFPDFSPHASQTVKIKMTGNDAKDFAAANDAVRELNPKWVEEPKGWTWHHNEDGVTMQLVPSALNRIPHTGGAALSSVPGF